MHLDQQITDVIPIYAHKSCASHYDQSDTEGWKGECEHGVGVREHLKAVMLTQVSSRSLIRHEHHPANCRSDPVGRGCASPPINKECAFDALVPVETAHSNGIELDQSRS